MVKRRTPEETIVTAASLLTALLLCVLAVALLYWWHHGTAQLDAPVRLPVTPPEHAALDVSAPREAGEVIDIEGSFAAGSAVAAEDLASWPRFRGAGFDNIGREPVMLAESWASEGPPVLWDLELGEGHGGAAVHNGRVYLLDYDERSESDLLRCHALDDGGEIWRRWYHTGAKRNHGISRAVPTVSDRYVLTVGPRCHVMCVDAVDGSFLWGVDLVETYGAKEPMWLSAQHPVLDGEVAVFAPGGRALMVAVDAGTGEVLWETPNPHGWQMSHASIVPMVLAGRKTWIYPALGGLVGVAADGDEVGSVLWETDAWDHPVVAPSAVPLGDDRLLVTAGFGVGSAIFRVESRADGYTVSLERRLERSEFASEQHTPVVYRDRVFTIMPRDGGAVYDQLVAMSPTGERLMVSGREQRFGLGPFLVADDKLFILDDHGVLTMAPASSSSFSVLARAKVLDGHDAWAPMAMAGGRLLLRDSERMVCLDLRASSGRATGPGPGGW